MTLSAPFAHLHLILREALMSPHGIVVEVTSTIPVANRTKVAEQRLYTITRTDADFRTLHIGLSPDYPDTELWIMHKAQLREPDPDPDPDPGQFPPLPPLDLESI